MTFNFTPIRFNWISSLSESCPGFTDMPAPVAGIAEEKEDYNYIHMTFDLFCPAVCRCLSSDVVQDSHNVKRPPHPLKKSKQHVDINKLETILIDTPWWFSLYIFFGPAPVNPQTNDRRWGLWDVDLNHVGIKTPSLLGRRRSGFGSKDPIEDIKWPVLKRSEPMNPWHFFPFWPGISRPISKYSAICVVEFKL